MKIGFALEYSLGHATHADNLKRFIAFETAKTTTQDASRDLQPVFVDIPFQNTLHGTPASKLSHLPGIRSNWSIRASVAAHLGLSQVSQHLDAALFHTQVTSLFSAGLMRRLPSVISLDATPLQYDALGASYGHIPSRNTILENLKKRINERAFHAATHLVTWSHWAKNSLIDSYNVPAEKVTVIPPGIDLDIWQPKTKRNKKAGGSMMNLLFVGGDFVRKGGDTLLAALQLLPASVSVRLDVVTRDVVTEFVETRANVSICLHRGLRPNAPALRQLYADADLFVFPTRADCLPLAVLEAMAMGIPVITTEIGALPEAIGNSDAGLIVPPDDPTMLAEAIMVLWQSPEVRLRMGCRAREIAEERFNSTRNYARLLRVLEDVAASSQRRKGAGIK